MIGRPIAQKVLLIGAWAVLAIALTIQHHDGGFTGNWWTVLLCHCILTLALVWESPAAFQRR